MSPITRIVSGILGFGGVAAIAFNAVTQGDLKTDYVFFTSLLGSFAFLYVAFFGTLPWRISDIRETDTGKMSKSKWQIFWIAFVVFLVMMTTFLARKGVFKEADIVILSLVGMIFALVGVALYFYIRNRAEDLDIR